MRHRTYALNRSNSQRNTYFYKKIRKIVREGHDVYTEILADNLTEERSFELERMYISFFGLKWDGGILYNSNGGGEGGHAGRSGSRHPRSKEVSQYTASGKLVATFASVNLASQATGVAHISITASCEERTDMGKGFIWRWGSEPEVTPNPKNRHVKEVAKVDDNNEIIEVYASTKEAAHKNGLDPSAITKCLKGKLATTGGTRWMYLFETTGLQYY